METVEIKLALAMILFFLIIIIYFFKKELLTKKWMKIILFMVLVIDAIYIYNIDYTININISNVYQKIFSVFLVPSALFFLTIKSLFYLEKFKKLLLIILLLEVFFFIYYMIYVKGIVFSYYESIFFFLTIYSSGVMVVKILEPIYPSLGSFMKAKKYRLDDFFFRNTFFNWIFFFKNYLTLVFCNLRDNNIIGQSVLAFFVIFLFPLLVFTGKFWILLYIYVWLIVSIFSNEVLLMRYKVKGKFSQNFDKNIMSISKVYYSVTKQTNPVKLKVIKRNMVKIAIEGYGYIETGPVPHKTARLILTAGTIAILIGGASFSFDSYNTRVSNVAKEDRMIEEAKYRADEAKNRADEAKHKADEAKYNLAAEELKQKDRRKYWWWH